MITWRLSDQTKIQTMSIKSQTQFSGVCYHRIANYVEICLVCVLLSEVCSMAGPFTGCQVCHCGGSIVRHCTPRCIVLRAVQTLDYIRHAVGGVAMTSLFSRGYCMVGSALPGTLGVLSSCSLGGHECRLFVTRSQFTWADCMFHLCHCIPAESLHTASP